MKEINEIIANWDKYAAILGSFVAFATAVIAVTPSLAKNPTINRLLDILARFSVIGRDEGIVEAKPEKK